MEVLNADSILLFCRDYARYNDICREHFPDQRFGKNKITYMSHRISNNDIIHAARGYLFDIILYDEKLPDDAMKYLYLNMHSDCKILSLKLYTLNKTLKQL